MVETQEELRGALADARGVAVEALTVGRDELAAAPKLKFVQKYGLAAGNIDTAACAERGVTVLTIRRRANIACAEHALALMLTQARKLDRFIGRVTVRELAEAGHHLQAVRPAAHAEFELGPRRRHPHAPRRDARPDRSWRDRRARSRARAVAFGMRVLYFQRRRLPEAEENARWRRLCAARHAPRRGRLADPATAGRSRDPTPDRRRATRPHEARRLHRQCVAAGRDRPRGTDRGAEVRTTRRLRARPAL